MKKTANKIQPPPVHPITMQTVKLLDLKPDKRYILFIDSANLIFESAQELATAMYRHGYNVSVILTDGEPKVTAVESDQIKELPSGSKKVEPKEEI